MNSTITQRPSGFEPWEISARVNQEVVQQHAEEVAFQWLLRDAAAQAPNYNLGDLKALDESVEANLDGLRTAGDYGWKVCEEQLAYEEPGEVFAAAMLAFESGEDERVQKVLDLAAEEKRLTRAVVSALGWGAYITVEPLAAKFMASEIPLHRYHGVGTYAAHRKDPGEILTQAINDPSGLVRTRAFKAAGELGRTDLLEDLILHSNEEDDNCRFHAAWSAARLGAFTEDIIAVLGDFVVMATHHADQALSLVLRCMPQNQAFKLYRKLKASPPHLRLTVKAAGIIGDPALVPDILEFMSMDDLSRAAGESFSMITGIDIEYEDLDRDSPEGFDAGIEEEDTDDETLDMDPDEDLPWPDPNLISAWWQKKQKEYKKGQRYLCGRPIDNTSLQTVLQNGNQRQRLAAALEVGIRNPTQHLFNVRAPGMHQMKLLDL